MNYCSKCKRDLPEGEKCPVCTPKKGVFIDMEMPKSCLECRFAYVAHTTFSGDILMCPYLGRGVSSKERDSGCPLQEVKE